MCESIAYLRLLLLRGGGVWSTRIICHRLLLQSASTDWTPPFHCWCRCWCCCYWSFHCCCCCWCRRSKIMWLFQEIAHQQANERKSLVVVVIIVVSLLLQSASIAAAADRSTSTDQTPQFHCWCSCCCSWCYMKIMTKIDWPIDQFPLIDQFPVGRSALINQLFAVSPNNAKRIGVLPPLLRTASTRFH